MSSFSPKNEGMIDCYQINYTTCHQLGDPKVSAMGATHCSIPPPSSNGGGRQRDVKQTSFAPTGSSFRFISEPPRSDDRHVYDMPHRRSNHHHHHTGRVLEVSDDPAVDTVAPLLVTLSSSDGMNVFSHHDNHHDGIQLEEEHSQFMSQSPRPVSPSEISVSQSQCEQQEHEQQFCRNQSSPTRIEFVHLFQCS